MDHGKAVNNASPRRLVPGRRSFQQGWHNSPFLTAEVTTIPQADCSHRSSIELDKPRTTQGPAAGHGPLPGDGRLMVGYPRYLRSSDLSRSWAPSRNGGGARPWATRTRRTCLASPSMSTSTDRSRGVLTKLMNGDCIRTGRRFRRCSHPQNLSPHTGFVTERRGMSWHVLGRGVNTCACRHATIAKANPNEDGGRLLRASAAS